MNTLDSRFIRLGNCFAHLFSAPGTFAYALSPLPSSFFAHHDEPPAQTVIVTAREDAGGTQRQHHVTFPLAPAHDHIIVDICNPHRGSCDPRSPAL